MWPVNNATTDHHLDLLHRHTFWLATTVICVVISTLLGCLLGRMKSHYVTAAYIDNTTSTDQPAKAEALADLPPKLPDVQLLRDAAKAKPFLPTRSLQRVATEELAKNNGNAKTVVVGKTELLQSLLQQRKERKMMAAQGGKEQMEVNSTKTNSLQLAKIKSATGKTLEEVADVSKVVTSRFKAPSSSSRSRQKLGSSRSNELTLMGSEDSLAVSRFHTAQEGKSSELFKTALEAVTSGPLIVRRSNRTGNNNNNSDDSTTWRSVTLKTATDSHFVDVPKANEDRSM